MDQVRKNLVYAALEIHSSLKLLFQYNLLFLSANVIPFEIGVRLGNGVTAIGDGFDLIYNQVPCQGAWL